MPRVSREAPRGSAEDREGLVPVSKGTNQEFWAYTAAGALLSLLPLLTTLLLLLRRKGASSYAARRGAMLGAGINSALVLLLTASSVWARTDIVVPIVQLCVMLACGVLTPVLLSSGVGGYLTVTGVKQQRHGGWWSGLDFAVGVVSSLVSFGVMMGASVLLLIRGLVTST
jgi:hypothetical protein